MVDFNGFSRDFKEGSKKQEITKNHRHSSFFETGLINNFPLLRDTVEAFSHTANYHFG